MTGGVELRLAAHAPHSVSAQLLRLVARGGVGSIHLAESPEEARFLCSGDGPWAEFLGRRGLGHVPFDPPGTTPVRYVDELGLLRPGWSPPTACSWTPPTASAWPDAA